MKLRSHLVTLVAVAVLPVLIFAVVMVTIYGNDQFKDVEAGLVQTARALSLAVDRELGASIRTLGGLATSERLDRDDLRGFYDQAARVLKSQGSWQTVALLDLSGQTLVNLRRPLGSFLPRTSDPDLIKRIGETGKPRVSDLFVGKVSGVPLIAVGQWVMRNLARFGSRSIRNFSSSSEGRG